MSATPEREQAEALQERAQAVLDVYGDSRRMVAVVARDVLALAAAVSRLEAERDEREAELDISLRTARAELVKEYGERVAAEARVGALVGRERELTQALARIAENAEDWHGPEGLGSGHAKALAVVGGWAREALAGGGRTPTGTDSGGDAVAVAEALRVALELTLGPLEHLVAIIEGRDERARLVTPHGTSSAGARRVLNRVRAVLTTATVSPPEPVSPGAADVAEAGEDEARQQRWDKFWIARALAVLPEETP